MNLYRVAYENSNGDGLCFFYALDEQDARRQYFAARNEPVLSVTPMPGGFTSGGYTTEERLHLPAEPGHNKEK